MPIYQYECRNGHRFERLESIGDPPRKRCPTCRTKVRRVVAPVGIIFKGSGFYITDNRQIGAGEGEKPSPKAKEKKKESPSDSE